MKLRARLFVALAVFPLLVTSVLAQLPNHTFLSGLPFDTNPYGLADLDNFPAGGYGYCRWGNLMSLNQDVTGLDYLFRFTVLTELPYSDANQDLFLNKDGFDGLTHLDPVSGFPDSIWNPGGHSVIINRLPSFAMTLFRKLHFSNSLTDIVGESELNSSTRKVIILIHGRNPTGDADQFETPAFVALKDAIKSRIQAEGSAWQLCLYRWERDADTGPNNLDLIRNATESAVNGHQHGQHLGELLAAKCTNLQKVHFIAHSAGTWAARAAARYLLQKTGVKVQVTILDPFIPGELPNNTPLTASAISGMPSMSSTGSGQLALLENYYAVEFSDLYGLENATSVTFGWNNTIGVQRRVDWGDVLDPILGIPFPHRSLWYGSHDGPIQFYADTVNSADALLSSGGLENGDFNLSLIGWKRSMFYVEPRIPSSLSAIAVSSSQINLAWSDTANETGFKIERRLGSSGSFSQIATRPANVTSYSDTGRSPDTEYSYRVRAYNSAGDSDYSNVRSVTTQPAVGTSHTLTIASSNPSSSVSVNSYVGSGSFASGSTPVNRTFAHGATVGVTCSATLVSGQIFQKWQLDGTDYAFSDVTSVLMDGAHTLTAVYGTTPPPVRTLSSLAIEGPSSVNERATAQYRARATYSDGSSAYVNAEWDEDSSYASISGTGLLDTEAVSSDREIEIEASFTAGGVTKSSTKDVTIRNTDTVPTYTLALNTTTGGSIGYSPKASSYAAGTVVSLHANEDDGYVFSHWSGDAFGTEDDIPIRMDSNRSVMAHFAVDTSIGNIRVDISPAQAVVEGAQWKYDNFTAWRDSESMLDGISPRTDRYVYFKDIPGWITPNSIKASIIGGETTVVPATYREILGSVQVTIEPSAAVTAGARWRLDDGVHLESGVALSDVATGNHTVEFFAAGGWNAAGARTVNVQRGFASVVVGIFDPPAGLPVISTLIPSSGGLDGGYSIEIEGANFGPNTTVTFGDIPAKALTVVSATRLIATVPAGPRYGSVSVAATSGGQTGTKLNGFSYSIPLGKNIMLLSQIGGTIGAVAASGSMVYYGEGGSIVSADYTTPTAPVIRGRLPLPGMVRDVRIAGIHALVANDNFGLQIVDVSDPVNLRLVGYYDTPGRALRLGVMGSVAYIADSSGGLQVIDFSDRTNPRQIGTFPVTSAYDVGVTQIGSRIIVCLASQAPNGTLVLDATDPAGIHQLSVVEGTLTHYSLALSATTLVCAGEHGSPSSTIGKIYDLSVPATPTKTHEGTFFQRMDVGVVNAGLLYSGTDEFEIYDLSVAPYPPRKSHTSLPGSTKGMALSGTTVFIARGSGGLIALDVSAPVSPVVRSTLNSNFRPVDIAVAGGKIHTAIDGGFSYSVTPLPVLTVMDVSDQRHPQRQGTAMANYGVNQIIMNGSTVYAAAGRGLTSFSVLDPDTPIEASAVQPGRDAYSIGYVNGHIAVGGKAGSGGGDAGLLSLYTMAGFQTGTPVSTLELTVGWGLTYALAVHGNTVFALVAENGLKCIDCSVPQTPRLLGIAPFPGTPMSAAVSADGRFVYVAYLSGGLQVFDCADLSQPTPFTSYVRNGQTGGNAVAVSGNLVFYADGNGVNVLDCTDPAHPKLVGFYDTPGRANAIRVSGNVIYVADGDGGLQILELGDLSKPLVEIIGPTRNGTFETNTLLIELTGTASDPGGVVSVGWRNDRGGGGAASGTTNWHIANILFQPGVNTITVAAEDTSGDVAEDTIIVIATPPDTTPPVLTITAPKPDHEFVVETNVITLSGSAADNQSVASVTWSNSFGALGSATLTGQNWNIPNVMLVSGPNEFHVIATDAAGNSAGDSAVIFFVPPDTNGPGISIEFPTLNAVYETEFGLVNLSGTAVDNVGVSRVEWSSNHGEQGTAAGFAPWSINDVPLQPGVNVIHVIAYDHAGNPASDSLAVTYTPPPAQFGNLNATNGAFTMELIGAVGATYAIQTSSDLGQWTPLYTNTIPVSGFIIINDPAMSNHLTRFYRALPVD